MSITLTQHKFTHSTANTHAVSVTMTSTAANVLLVAVGMNTGTRTVTGVTDNIGNTYTQAAGAAHSYGGGGHEGDIWYCLSAAAGVTSITVTFSGANGTFDKDSVCFEVAGFVSCGLDVVAKLDDSVATSGTQTGAAIVTTSTVGFIVADAITAGVISQNPKAGNEFTSGGDICTTTTNSACSLISTTAASHTPAWGDNSSSGTNCCSGTVAFKETAAVAASGRLLLLGC